MLLKLDGAFLDVGQVCPESSKIWEKSEFDQIRSTSGQIPPKLAPSLADSGHWFADIEPNSTRFEPNLATSTELPSMLELNVVNIVPNPAELVSRVVEPGPNLIGVTLRGPNGSRSRLAPSRGVSFGRGLLEVEQ